MIEKKTVSMCITSDYCKGWNDAVDSIVHCKDCIHYKPLLVTYHNAIYECMYSGIFTDHTDYCSMGKRRGE